MARARNPKREKAFEIRSSPIRGALKVNKNAVGNNGGAPPRNQNAIIHGLFAKFLPDETLEIIEHMNKRSPADLI